MFQEIKRVVFQEIQGCISGVSRDSGLCFEIQVCISRVSGFVS